MGGGLPDLLQYYIGGGLPNLLQYYIGGGLESLLQYYSFERKMEGYNPFILIYGRPIKEVFLNLLLAVFLLAVVYRGARYFLFDGYMNFNKT